MVIEQDLTNIQVVEQQMNNSLQFENEIRLLSLRIYSLLNTVHEDDSTNILVVISTWLETFLPTLFDTTEAFTTQLHRLRSHT